ncbi:MAG: hypothetical protein RL062_965 [Bacteroidota bacterium]
MKKVLFLLPIALMTLWACHKEKQIVEPLQFGTVTDVDGNIYKTVKIGSQWWMCENLKVEHYNDGSAIHWIDINGLDSNWSHATDGAYCYINDSIYGKLYNYLAVSDARKLAPEGWHIPTDSEWQTLEKSIGMSDAQTAGLAWRGTAVAEKLLVKSSIGWPANSVLFGTDEVGFSALPGGVRISNGSINTSQSVGFWWTSTMKDNLVYYRYIDAQFKGVFRQYTQPSYGMSIRCVKD